MIASHARVTELHRQDLLAEAARARLISDAALAKRTTTAAASKSRWILPAIVQRVCGLLAGRLWLPATSTARV
jgi:hypothetical protein